MLIDQGYTYWQDRIEWLAEYPRSLEELSKDDVIAIYEEIAPRCLYTMAIIIRRVTKADRIPRLCAEAFRSEL